MKILIISHFFPYPFYDGGGRRFQNIIKALQERHEITFVVFIYNEKNEQDLEAFRKEWERVKIIPVPYPRGGSFNRLNKIKWLLNPVARPIIFCNEMKELVEKLIRAESYDIVQFEYAQTGQYLPHSAPHTNTVRDMPPSILVEHDIISLAQLRRARVASGVKRKIFEYKNWLHLKRYERGVLSHFDKIVTMSEADKKTLRRAMPGLDIAVVPNGVDTDYCRPSDTIIKPRLIFMAGIKHYANTDAAQYFIKDMWPLIKEGDPEVKLYFLGNYPIEEEGNLDLSGKVTEPRIMWTGMVEDTRPYLSGSIFVAPIRIASGTRLKILEAMSMGCAIISTTIGAEGILAEPGREILIADTPHDFANVVLELLRNPARRREIGQKARALVEKRYDWRTILNIQEKLYEDIVK